MRTVKECKCVEITDISADIGIAIDITREIGGAIPECEIVVAAITK